MSDSSDGEVPIGWTVVNEDGHAQDSDSSSSTSSCDVALDENVVHFRHMPRRSSSISIKSPKTSRRSSVSSKTPTDLNSSPDGLKPRSPAGASSLPANFRAHPPEKNSLVFGEQDPLECEHNFKACDDNPPNAWPQGARPKLNNCPEEQSGSSKSNNPTVRLPTPSHLVTTQQEGHFDEEDDIDEEEDEFAAEASDGKADNTSMSSIEILSSDGWSGIVEVDGAPYQSMQPLITSGALSLDTDHLCHNHTETQASNHQSTSSTDSDFERVDPEDPAMAQEAESVELRAPCTARRLQNDDNDAHAEYVEAAAASPLVEEDPLLWRNEAFKSTSPLSASSYSLPSDIPPVDVTRSPRGWKDIGHGQYPPRYQDFPEDEDGDMDDSLGPPGRLAGEDALRRRYFARRWRREMSMSVSSSASDLSSFSFLGLRRQSSRQSINRQHSDDVSEISSIFTDGSDDLPANMMVSTTKPGPKQYKHKRAERLNNTLNYVVLLVLASVCALGVGHYVGSYQEKYYMHTIRTGQVKRLRELQDDLVTCLDKRTTTDDKKTFAEMVRTLLGDDIKQDELVSDLDDEVGDTNDVDDTGDVNMNCSLCSDAKYRYSELCNTVCVQGGFWAELDDAIADLTMPGSEVERDNAKMSDGGAGNLHVEDVIWGESMDTDVEMKWNDRMKDESVSGNVKYINGIQLQRELSAEINKAVDELQVPGDNDVVEMTVGDEFNGETSSENAEAVNSGPGGFWATLDEAFYEMTPLPELDKIGITVSDEFIDEILAENAEIDNSGLGGFKTEVDEVIYGTIPVPENNIEIELTVGDELSENAKTVDRGGFWAELDGAIYDTIPVPKNDEIEVTVSDELVDEPLYSRSVNKEPIYADSINLAEDELNTYEEESDSNFGKNTYRYKDTNIPSGKEPTYSYEEAIKLEEKFKRKEDKLEEEEFGFIVQNVIVMPQTSEEEVIDRVDIQNDKSYDDDDDADGIHIEVEDDYEEIGLDPKNNDQSETVHPKEDQDDMFVNPEEPEQLNATSFILKEFKEEIAAKSRLKDLEEQIETAQNRADMWQKNDDDDWILIEVEDDNEEIDLDPNNNNQSETIYPKEEQDDMFVNQDIIIPEEPVQLNATAFILKEFKDEIAAKSRLEELEEQLETAQNRADMWQRKFVGDHLHKPHPAVVIVDSLQDSQETKSVKDFRSHKKIEDLEKQLDLAKAQANMWQSRYLEKSRTARPAEKVEREDEKSDEEPRSAPQQDKPKPAFEQEKTSEDSSEKTNKDRCGPLGCFNIFENILADFLNSVEGKEFLRFANLTEVLNNASFWEELTLASNISTYTISSAVYQSWVEFQQYVKSAQTNNFISNFTAVLARAGESVVTAFGTVKNYSTVLNVQINSTLSGMGETAQSAWDNMRNFTSDTIDQHTQSAQDAFEKVKNMSADSKVSEKVQHAWNTMRNFSENTFQGQNISLSNLKEKVAAAWSSVRNISAQVVSNDTKKTLSDVVSQVTETVKGIGQTVQETWKPVKHFIGDWHRNKRLRKEHNRRGSHKKKTEDEVGKTDEDDPSQVKRSRKHTRTNSLHADEPRPKIKNKREKGANHKDGEGCKGKKCISNKDGESKYQKNFGSDNIKGKKDKHHQKQKDEKQNHSSNQKHNKHKYKHNHRKNRINRRNNQKLSGHPDQWDIDWDDLLDVFNMNCYSDADCLSHQRRDGARLYDELKEYQKWLKSHHRKREVKEVRKFLKVLEEFLSEPVLDDEHLEDLKEKFEDVLEKVGRFVQDQHERSGQDATVEGTIEELEENSTVILDLELLKNEKTGESSHSGPERRKFAGHGHQINVDDDNWFLRRAKDREEQHQEEEGDHKDSNWYLHWMQGRTDSRTGVTVWDMYRWITERYSYRDDIRHHEDINWFLKRP